MRSFHTRGAQEVVRLENFSGLQYRAPAKDTCAPYDLCNLRRMNDGTLSRREGFSPVALLPEQVRGAVFCEGEDGGIIYVVAGSHAYALREQSNGSYLWERIGTLRSEEGEVSFFTLDGDVILMDGAGMYMLRPETATEMVPYIPLYGKDWTPDEHGTLYEQRNVLTDRVTIRYIVPVNAYGFGLFIDAVSIDRVVVNGNLVSEDAYTFDAGTGRLTFANILGTNSQVDVVMTLPADAESAAMRQDFLQCRSAVRPGESGRTVTMFGGGAQNGVLYLTEDIPQADRQRCRMDFPESCMLYLLPDGRRELGDGTYGITAMVRHYDRTLIMTEAGCWSVEPSALAEAANARPCRMVNSRLGCSVSSGALTVGNRPISICGGEVLEWTANTDRVDECNAESLSDAVRELLPVGLGERGHIYYDRFRREVWFYLSDGSARVFVWQEDGDAWTTFDFGSFPPACVFGCGERIGIGSGHAVYLSHGAASGDVNADGTSGRVVCGYTSHSLHFGHNGRQLLPYEVMICADAEKGDEIAVTLGAPDGRECEVVLQPTGEQPFEDQRRVRLGRCRHAVVRLECAADGPFTLRLLAVATGR